MHHETVHDQGFQLPEQVFNLCPKRLGSLVHDARLWKALKLERAVISSKIQSPYRAQFHEVVAFEQQALFKKELHALVFPEQTPQQAEKIPMRPVAAA